jgi:hypothetical protein
VENFEQSTWGVLLEGVYVGTVVARDRDEALDVAVCRYAYGDDRGVEVFDPEDEL